MLVPPRPKAAAGRRHRQQSVVVVVHVGDRPHDEDGLHYEIDLREVDLRLTQDVDLHEVLHEVDLDEIGRDQRRLHRERLHRDRLGEVDLHTI